jgi:hypothetical protein
MSALDEFHGKGTGMKPEREQSDNTNEASAPQMEASHTDEEDLIGNQEHDHLWWGKVGRPAERNGSLANDQGGTSDREIRHIPYVGGHDADWQEK